MSWELFNDIYVLKRNGFKAFDSNSLASKDYPWLFSQAFESSYNRFVRENRDAIENVANNFVIDFELCESHPDSGYAVFWVQAVKPNHYHPKSGPFREIPIQGIMFEIRWFNAKQIVNGTSYYFISK